VDDSFDLKVPPLFKAQAMAMYRSQHTDHIRRWDGIVGFHRLRRSAKRKNVLSSQPDAPITHVSWLTVFGNNDTHCWGEPTRILTLQARCQRVDIRRGQLDARAPTAIIAEPAALSEVFFSLNVHRS
jgi:hypothetical protein